MFVCNYMRWMCTGSPVVRRAGQFEKLSVPPNDKDSFTTVNLTPGLPSVRKKALRGDGWVLKPTSAMKKHNWTLKVFFHKNMFHLIKGKVTCSLGEMC